MVIKAPEIDLDSKQRVVGDKKSSKSRSWRPPTPYKSDAHALEMSFEDELITGNAVMPSFPSDDNVIQSEIRSTGKNSIRKEKKVDCDYCNKWKTERESACPPKNVLSVN